MRDFTWGMQEVAENCLQERDHVHIVITSPGSRVIQLPCKKTTLRLFFVDLDPSAIRQSEAFANDAKRGQALIDACFTEEHAEHIELFVRSTDPSDVIVNCEAGVSRSPAVVLALRQKYGGDADWVFKKAYPNLHVANVLGRVLGVGPFVRPPSDGKIVTSLFAD